MQFVGCVARDVCKGKDNMKKIITYCDYCGTQIEGESRFLLSGLEIDQESYHHDDLDFRYDICETCFKSIRDLISTAPLQKRSKAKAEPEIELEEPHVASDKGKPAKTPAAKKPNKEVDHGRIIALYTAKPQRSIAWIADDCKCSKQTVINHLTKAGIYGRTKRAAGSRSA